MSILAIGKLPSQQRGSTSNTVENDMFAEVIPACFSVTVRTTLSGVYSGFAMMGPPPLIRHQNTHVTLNCAAGPLMVSQAAESDANGEPQKRRS
jgi:hypothetical protein